MEAKNKKTLKHILNVAEYRFNIYGGKQRRFIDLRKEIEFKIGAINLIVEHDINIEELTNILSKTPYLYNIIQTKDKYEYKYSLENFMYNRTYIYIYKNKFHLVEDINVMNIKYSDHLLQDLETVFKSLSLFKLLGNYNNKNNVIIKTLNFFDHNGYNYYSGGAERYLLDLHNLLAKEGVNVDIIQYGNYNFFRKYKNVNVIGLRYHSPIDNYYESDPLSRMQDYLNYTYDKVTLTIFSSFLESLHGDFKASIGISHGVFWDDKYVKYYKKMNPVYNYDIINAAKNVNKLISVDTNTCNWFQTIDYELGRRIKYIPNYVDVNEFTPKKSKKNNKRIVITYPRRLYEPRGMYLLLDIIDDLFKLYENVDIKFVGKGFDNDVKAINRYINKYPGRIECYSLDPYEMHKAYQDTDISLIPTLYSEGTSLSCLEALATENIVIATRIGGLTDLIIDGFNGYLIEPNSEALLNKLKYILDNYENQLEIRKNAREIAKAFNKTKWENRWKEELSAFDIPKSKNIGHVEIFVNDINKISLNVFEFIKKQLLENNLVYLRVKKPLKGIEKYSFGLFQVVKWDDEILNDSKIYAEKGLKIPFKLKGLERLD